MDIDISERVRTTIAAHFRLEDANVTLESRFVEDLKADSLDLIELLQVLEDEFHIRVKETDAIGMSTIGDIVAYLTKLVEASKTAGADGVAPPDASVMTDADAAPAGTALADECAVAEGTVASLADTQPGTITSTSPRTDPKSEGLSGPASQRAARESSSLRAASQCAVVAEPGE